VGRWVLAAIRGAVAVATLSAAGCGTTVDMHPAAASLGPAISTVVGLPVSLGWGGPSDLRRIQRRTSDALIDASGGHAAIAEELTVGEDDAAIASALRALGEDPGHALSFAVSESTGGRVVTGVSAIPGFIAGKQMIVDFKVHLEVRQVGSPELLGSVDTVASGRPNEPEIGPDGEKRAPIRAIAEAIEKALAKFAPALVPMEQPAVLVEVPAEAAVSLSGRLKALGELYPELSTEDMQLLAQNRERFLVRDPGYLTALGVARGDLLGVPGRESAATRAALARAVARHRKPLLAIQRAGQRYVIAGR
jgi:hypothetical protein